MLHKNVALQMLLQEVIEMLALEKTLQLPNFIKAKYTSINENLNEFFMEGKIDILTTDTNFPTSFWHCYQSS